MDEKTYRCLSAGCGWAGSWDELAEVFIPEEERESDEDYRLVCPDCGSMVEEVEDEQMGS